MTIKTEGVPRGHWEKICERWQAGDSQRAIGKDHGVSGKAIKKILVELNAYERIKPQPRPGNGTDMKAFTKAARAILWSQDRGTDHVEYNKWEDRIIALSSEEGANYSRNEAIVAACKEFKCLHRLFREYDISPFDPNPESNPQIKRWGNTSSVDDAEEKVKFTGGEYSYCDNLRWAMEAAGNYLNTKGHPTEAPNGSAFFFYRQAIDEPKDFMAKFGQMESKAGGGDGDEGMRKESKRTIAELHAFLEELDNEESEEKNAEIG